MELLSDWGFLVIVYLYVCFRYTYIPRPLFGVRSTEYRGNYSQQAFLKLSMNMEEGREILCFFFCFFFPILLFLIRAFPLPGQISSAILTELTFLASVDKVGDNAGESLQHATCNVQRGELGTWNLEFGIG